MSERKEVDHLTVDPQLMEPPGYEQKWLLISFVSSDKMAENKNDIKGLVKVRGVFSDLENARKKAKYLNGIDPDFHIYVAPVGHWLEFDPSDPEKVSEEQEYHEQKLNELMKGHKDSLEKAKEFEEQRKREMIAKMAKEEEEKKKKNDKERGSKMTKEERKANKKKAKEAIRNTQRITKVPLPETIHKEQEELNSARNEAEEIRKQMERIKELHRLAKQ